MLHYYGCTVSMKRFSFFMATCPLQVSHMQATLCCPWSGISELWLPVIILFLTFCNSLFSFSESHARFILYRRFFYILTVVGFKFALCFCLEYVLLFPGLCSFLYNTQCQKFFIFAPHLVSDNLILGTVLTQQIPSTGSHFPDNIRSRALYLNLWAQFLLLHNALQQDIVWYKT